MMQDPVSNLVSFSVCSGLLGKKPKQTSPKLLLCSRLLKTSESKFCDSHSGDVENHNFCVTAQVNEALGKEYLY